MTTLAALKLDLRIEHQADDALLTALLAAAESEAKSFCNRASLPADAAIDSALHLLVRSKYDASVEPQEMAKYRMVAEQLLIPHRVELGL